MGCLLLAIFQRFSAVCFLTAIFLILWCGIFSNRNLVSCFWCCMFSIVGCSYLWDVLHQEIFLLGGMFSIGGFSYFVGCLPSRNFSMLEYVTEKPLALVYPYHAPSYSPISSPLLSPTYPYLPPFRCSF